MLSAFKKKDHRLHTLDELFAHFRCAAYVFRKKNCVPLWRLELQLSTSEADALSIALQGQFVPAWILP